MSQSAVCRASSLTAAVLPRKWRRDSSGHCWCVAGERTVFGSSLLLTGTVHVIHPFHVESNGITRRHIPDKLDNVRGIPQVLQVNAGIIRPLCYSIFVPTLPTSQFINRPQTLTATPHATAAQTISLARPTNWGAQFSYLPSVMSGPSSAQLAVAKVSWNTVQIRELSRYLVSTSEPLLVDSLISREISAELGGRSTKLRPEIRVQLERDMRL